MKIGNLTIQIYDKGEWKTLNKNKFKFQIGEEVVFHFFSRQTKVKIVGYDGDNYVIKLGEDNYLTAARGQLSTLKKPDELEVGDKFEDYSGNTVKILARENNPVNTTYYFGRTNSENIDVWTHYDVREIIYD